MTGGNVVESTCAEALQIFGRVSSAGAKVAPANGGKWTVSVASTNQYSILFAESYPEYLGAVCTVEGSTEGWARPISYTASTRTLLIKTFTGTIASPSNTALAFSFHVNFSENKAV